MNKRNDFICIGAVHTDYILKLKSNYFKNRTNPIYQEEHIGGVSYNIAKILAFLNENIDLYSLNCNTKQKKEINSHGIKFVPLNRKIIERHYTSILDKNGKMILGLANMDIYEKDYKYQIGKFANLKNKKIILDLNFSSKLIKNIINTCSKKNYICVCGTSAHKVYKITNLLNKIDTLILNKQESLTLTNQKKIKDSLKYLIKKNKKLNIIITNGKNIVNAYINKTHYASKPPYTIIKNENGAGDTLSAFFNYFFFKSIDQLDSLNKAISAGSLQASGYINYKKEYLQKLNRLSKSIRYKINN